jgi:hypothetical protein
MLMVLALLIGRDLCLPPSLFPAASIVVPAMIAIPVSPSTPIIAISPNDVEPIDPVKPTSFFTQWVMMFDGGNSRETVA